MNSKAPSTAMKKRPHEECGSERPRKSPFGVVKVEDDATNEPKVFKFRVLLPNGNTLELKLSELRNEMPIEEFIDIVRTEYVSFVKQRRSKEQKRRINWNYQDLHFTDAHTQMIRIKVNFRNFAPNKWHFLRLHDGSAEPEAYEDMWDLTPDTDLLKELPDDYTFETALADLIDNSLQALWSNDVRERRLISVELHPDRITIFDSGPGMDGTDGNLVKWGKMGASLHRSARAKAVGGKPPYLMPFFGMFGYGGPVATMCLGRRSVVSSKTKNCKKVFTLHLEREALMNASHSENCWRTKGGMRDPLQDEKENSPHGSFTKVEIFDPKMKALNVEHFKCRLKDIYFPYIQCDEVSGKTSRPAEFKVNGVDLAEIQGGEVATTYLHSCNGPNFILQLHLSISQDPSSTPCQSQREFLEANARLKCVYFPIIEGEESINNLIDELHKHGFGIERSFESFSRVSVRRLGRLLPDTRWGLLPFMEPKQKLGEKAQMFKRCCSRVKCFIDTDSGFNPTPHKTDLAHHHPYTKALKNFGHKLPENEKEVQIEIFRDGKRLTLTQLEKQYNDWISEMHDRYDGEVDRGLDEPTLLVVSSKIKKLGISSDVLRVHKKIQRKGKCWAAGQKIKVLKGACAGCHSNNVFATLEYIILEGLPGDSCGEARLICRPLEVPEEKGCHLSDENGNRTIDIRDSLALPIRIIDYEKCIPVDDSEWDTRLSQRFPSAIDLLSHINCQELEIEGGPPPDIVEAGDTPPENIIAVIRPKAFNAEKCSKRLDQKFIIRENHYMTLEVKYRVDGKTGREYVHVFSVRMSPSSHKGLHGLYVFPVKLKHPDLFWKAGLYRFSLSLNKFKDVRFEHTVQVQASAKVGRWKLLHHQPDAPYTVRVGCCFELLSVACYDRYKNLVLFTRVPKLSIKLSSGSTVLSQVRSVKVGLTTDKSSMTIQGIIIKTDKLDNTRPKYEATLNISTLDEAFSVSFPCRVIPGAPQKITAHPPELKKQLIPGQIIEDIRLEVFDEYGNHAKEDENILLSVDGFSFQDGSGLVHKMGVNCIKKVDAEGFVDLSNILKVSKGYGQDVSLSAISDKKVILNLKFQTETRELRAVPNIFKNCQPGSQLENIVFEIINSKGDIDETIHDEEKYGQSHTLRIKSSSFDIDDNVRYSFRHGRCTIRSIPLPQAEGTFTFSAAHSRYPELNSDIEVHVEKAWQENQCAFWNHSNIGNCECVGTPVFSSRSSCENSVILTPSPSSKASEVVHKNFSPPSSNGYVLPINWPSSPKTPKWEHTAARKENLNASPIQVSAFQHFGNVVDSAFIPQKELGGHLANCALTMSNRQKENLNASPIQVSASQDIGNVVDSAFFPQKELGDHLANSALTMTNHQKNLEMLNLRRLHLLQNISDLQASIDRDLPNVSSTSVKDLTKKQIESKCPSAAAVICKIHEEVPFESRPQGILGVVALLGAVETIELSRMLAQYLGEDQMCAIVCKNYDAAYDLERSTLHKYANKFGQSVSGGYLAFCLEDIRPSIEEPRGDPEGLLTLPRPTLPDGNVPQGFLGHAVNIITIEESHLSCRTARGHGLRETLFFRLFGELQVYRDRESMMAAKSCIKDEALSLDGGIIRSNGLVSLGNWEPDVLFPVRNKAVTRESLQTLHVLERYKLELMQINQQIDEEKKSYERVSAEFFILRDRYNSYVSQNEPSSATRSEPTQ